MGEMGGSAGHRRGLRLVAETNARVAACALLVLFKCYGSGSACALPRGVARRVAGEQ